MSLTTLSPSQLSLYKHSRKRYITTPHALLVSRGREIFAYIEGELRFFRADAAHASSSSSPQTEDMGAGETKQIHIRQLDFTPLKLEINQKGTLLAIVGKRNIVVVILPPPAAIKMKDRIECKSMIVGAYHHQTDILNAIEKVLWHPLADEYAHLCVLSTNGIYRIYDLTHNHEDPEQTYFFLDDTTSKSVAAVENAKAVSFTFGGDNGYWGPFTIMILLSNGDVYTACPIMPKTSIVSNAQLDNLSSLLDSEIPDSFTYNFIRNLTRTSKPHPVASSMCTVHHPFLTQPGYGFEEIPVPALAGPYLITPSPIEICQTDEDANEILFATEGGVGLIGIVYGSGKIDLGVMFTETGPFWETDEDIEEEEEDDETYYNSQRMRYDLDSRPAANNITPIYLFETIDLSLLELIDGRDGLAPPIMNTCQIQFDTADPWTFYVTHSAGVHRVSCGNWVGIVEQGVKEGASSAALEEALDTKACSRIDGIISTIPYSSCDANPIIGFAQLNIPLTGQILAILTSSMQMIWEPVIRYDAQSRYTEPPQETQLPPYPSALRAMKWTKPDIGAKSKVVFPRSKTGNAMDGWAEWLARTGEEVIDRCRTLREDEIEASTRIALQIEEHTKIKRSSQEMLQKIAKVKNENPILQDKILKLQNVQQNLTRRWERLVQRITSSSSANDTEAEIMEEEFRTSIEQMHRFVKVTAQSQRVQTSEQLKMLRADKAKPENSKKPEKMSETELEELNAKLAAEDNEMRDLTEIIENLDLRLSHLPA